MSISSSLSLLQRSRHFQFMKQERLMKCMCQSALIRSNKNLKNANFKGKLFHLNRGIKINGRSLEGSTFFLLLICVRRKPMEEELVLRLRLAEVDRSDYYIVIITPIHQFIHYIHSSTTRYHYLHISPFFTVHSLFYYPQCNRRPSYYSIHRPVTLPSSPILDMLI